MTNDDYEDQYPRVAGSRSVVLLGAGHAHLEAIRFAGSFARRGCQFVVVAPGPYWYSGMATAMLGGACSADDDRIDVARMVERGGGRFVCDRAEAIDLANRVVSLSTGASLCYDLLSLSLGSEVPTWRVPGLTEHAIAVKPINNLLLLRDQVSAQVAGASSDRPVRIVVIGGGATACEVAGNLHGLAARSGGQASITLVARGDRLLTTWSQGASAIAVESLTRRGVDVQFGSPVSRVETGLVFKADGSRVPYDLLVAATGLVPSRLIRESGLPTDAVGGLRVDEHLRSLGHPEVFGGGDCIALDGHDLARVGVHGVRQAPILRHNLLAALEGRPPWAYRQFRPQAHVLQILNLGDGTGLASRGGWLWHSKLVLRLKNRIDHNYLASYR